MSRARKQAAVLTRLKYRSRRSPVSIGSQRAIIFGRSRRHEFPFAGPTSRPPVLHEKCGPRNPSALLAYRNGNGEKTAHEGGDLVLTDIHYDQAITPMPQFGNIETRIAREKTKITLLAEKDDDLVVLHPLAPDVDTNPRFAIDRGRVIYLPLPPPNDNSSYRWFDLVNAASPMQEGKPPLLTNGTRHQFAVLGKIVADGPRHVLYHVSDRAGLLLALQNSDLGIDLLFARTTVDNTPLPDLERQTVGEATVTSIAFRQPIVAIGVAFERDSLWVLTPASVGPKRFEHVLDVYDGQTGDYRFSYKLPFRCNGIAARAGVVYFIGDNSIQAWRAS
jgi:hypothetical protein